MDNTIDQEMMAEVERAYQIAYQYRMNTLRIRKLLSYNPITSHNGGRLIADNGLILLGYMEKRGLTNPSLLFVRPYIHDSLIIS